MRPPPRPRPAIIKALRRLDALTELPESECWKWTGLIDRRGYGFFQDRLKRHGRNPAVYMHRVAYEMIRGPIPAGLSIDHLCRNRACVNPAHMEAVTNAENLRRGMGPHQINGRKTHCHRGHEFTSENTRIDRGTEGRPARRCRRCAYERWYRQNGKPVPS